MSDLSDLYAEAAALKAASVDTANHYNQAYAFLGLFSVSMTTSSSIP